MLRYYKYCSEFISPFKTAVGTFTHREGIILCFETEAFTAYGEVAPLPGFSDESISEVLAVLIHNKKFLEQAFLNDDAEQLISVLDHIHKFPSLSFGLDTLLYDYKAKEAGISLSEFLFQQKEISVPCNAIIGISKSDEIGSNVSAKVDSGFSTIKLKVGIDFESELQAIRLIREQYPALKIRIDANRSWTLEEAKKNLSAFTDFYIEYCEEPLQSPNESNLTALKNSVGIKLAADESVRNIQQVREVTEKNLFDLLIIKPALLGRFDNITVTKQLSDTHNKEVVFTTSFDGVIGRIATAVLTSGLGTKNFAHGLATESFLKEQGVSSKQLKKGVFSVSGQNGLDSPVDLTYLDEIS